MINAINDKGRVRWPEELAGDEPMGQGVIGCPRPHLPGLAQLAQAGPANIIIRGTQSGRLLRPAEFAQQPRPYIHTMTS